MTLKTAIKKYNLIKQERDCLGCLYNHEVYAKQEEKDGIRKTWTVEQDELAKEENERKKLRKRGTAILRKTAHIYLIKRK